MTRKRILFLIDALPFGGVERVLLNLLSQLDRNKYELGLFLFEKTGALLSDVPEDVTLHVGRSSQKRLRYELPQLTRRALETVKDYDTLVACSPSSTFLLYATRALHRKTWCSWVHFNFAQFMPSIPRVKAYCYTRAYRATKTLVAVSEGALAALREGVPERSASSTCIYNILNRGSYYRPSQCLGALRLLRERYRKPVVLFVGRLSGEKGTGKLLETARLLARLPEAPVVAVIGSGPEEPVMRADIQAHQLQDSVHLLGPDLNPYPCIEEADALLMCSRHEALPTVILESFMAGTPVVSFDSPTGPRELLGQSVNGVLVPHGDCEQLAAAATALVRDGTRCKHYAEQGRLAVRQFEAQHITPQWDALFGAH